MSDFVHYVPTFQALYLYIVYIVGHNLSMKTTIVILTRVNQCSRHGRFPYLNISRPCTRILDLNNCIVLLKLDFLVPNLTDLEDEPLENSAGLLI